eukprot:2307907-Amphidinium_carterae.1
MVAPLIFISAALQPQGFLVKARHYGIIEYAMPCDTQATSEAQARKLGMSATCALDMTVLAVFKDRLPLQLSASRVLGRLKAHSQTNHKTKCANT